MERCAGSGWKMITIENLTVRHADLLSKLLSGQSSEYGKFFHPFPFDRKSIKNRLSRTVRDYYWGIFSYDILMGYFMLRGWDEGYEIPSFGVLIDEAYRNRGLATLSLNFAIVVARYRCTKRIMLKVHPKNVVARSIYEKVGFKYSGPTKEERLYFYDIPRQLNY